MKQLLLPFLLLFFLIPTTQASHMQGGEIGWRCGGNGTYIFTLKLYRNCAGIPFPGMNEFLQVLGSPQPRDIHNNVVSTITMNFVSSTSYPLECQRPSNAQLSCNGNNTGFTVQEAYYYESDTLRLIGSPSDSWTFSYAITCCRPFTSNLALGGASLLRSRMYFHGGNRCIDNSPEFLAPPDFSFCRNMLNEYSQAAQDFDQDELRYSVDYTYNTPATNPVQVPFTNNFSLTKLSPDTNGGQAIRYDSLNGMVSFYDKSSPGPTAFYHFNRRVDAYRNGRLISTTFRDLPISIGDCPSLPNGAANQAPRLTPPFVNNGIASYEETLTVGSVLSANLNITDTNRWSIFSQNISVQVFSQNLTLDYSAQGICRNPSDTNCAYISSSAAVILDSRNNVYEFNRLSPFNGVLNWTTDCSDLNPDGTAKTHYFVVRMQDGYCPIPAVSYQTIAVTVLPDPNNPCQLATELDEQKWKAKVQLYPNPSNGNFSIQLPEQLMGNLKIRNIAGQLVYEERLANQSQIELELDVNQGVYFLEIQRLNGQRLVQKMIIQ